MCTDPSSPLKGTIPFNRLCSPAVFSSFQPGGLRYTAELSSLLCAQKTCLSQRLDFDWGGSLATKFKRTLLLPCRA